MEGTQIEKKVVKNNGLSYMSFALGAILILVSIFLFTYTTVEMVNTKFNIYGSVYTVPVATKVQPYIPIGIITLLAAIALIGFAFYNIKKAT